MDQSLPPEYALAFYKLHHHLIQLSKEPINRIETVLGADTAGFEEIFGYRSPPKDKSFYALSWLIQALCDERQFHLARLPYLMDELARTMGQDTGAKELVHSWVANQISDLAVFAHYMHQVDLYQPWAATFASRMVDKKDEVEQDYADTLKMIDPYLKVPGPTNIVSLAILSDGNSDYPVARSRNRKNIEAIRLAEAKLDSFWSALNRALAAKNAVGPRMRQVLSQRVLQSTLEWVEPTAQTKRPTANLEADAITKPLSELYFGLEKNTERTIRQGPLTAPKAKSKARGISQQSGDPVPEILECHLPDVQPSFHLDARALRAFNAVFFTPSASSQSGELAWGDFLHALISTGFLAEKLYKSVWQLIPTKLDAERPIPFHETHPGGKIPFTTARWHGRRLNRAFGWHVGMFVPK
ncbi:hypothetical protein LTS18_010531 [Coniosporium uncinatum]|uniref:Uncharacterized protein n=1 Tax=Coniosporium uncinatum TaxID=93489 RepID=A0ACC3DA77_9PEZI|nr:hypothetical protein LTS18_010531 [Coniosporium uncinatum]